MQRTCQDKGPTHKQKIIISKKLPKEHCFLWTRGSWVDYLSVFHCLLTIQSHKISRNPTSESSAYMSNSTKINQGSEMVRAKLENPQIAFLRI